MCGRFAITLPTDAMAQLFAATPANDLPDVPNFNVCPTNRVHVVRRAPDAEDETAARQLVSMRWGFIPHWARAANDGPLLINARAETIAQKPAFKSAARSRRAIMPVSGFYEWTKDGEGGRDPWYFTRSDETPLAFAAIWQEWRDKSAPDEVLTTCAIVTTAANKAVSAVHHRMPVILEPQDWGKWLGEDGHGAATLMRAAPEEALQWHRVARTVNSNRAEGPALINRISSEADHHS